MWELVMQENLTFLQDLWCDFRNPTCYMGKFCTWETLYMVINSKLFQNNVQPIPPFSHCPLYNVVTDMLCTKGNRKHTNLTFNCLLFCAIT